MLQRASRAVLNKRVTRASSAMKVFGTTPVSLQQSRALSQDLAFDRMHNESSAWGTYTQRPVVSIIGVPFSGGQPKGGVDGAPSHIRKAGLVQELEAMKWTVNDIGDIDLPGKSTFSEDAVGRVKNPNWAGTVAKNVYTAVKRESQAGKLPIILGGDHSIAVGTVAGSAAAYPDLGVLWVDAHADINTSGSTPSGNLHGMPLSFLMGLTEPVPGFEWLDMDKPVLARDQLVYIGLRDLETSEKNFLRKHNIKSFDMHDIDSMGIGEVMKSAMKIFGHRPLHLSFDIDSLDPNEAPSTGTRVRGGLSFREGSFVCEFVHKTNQLVSMDLVEINPALGTPEEVELTVNTGISMLTSALGETLT